MLSQLPNAVPLYEEAFIASGMAPTTGTLADAVERELDRLGVAQFHVAGYSLGARVALELATRGRTHSVIAIAPEST